MDDYKNRIGYEANAVKAKEMVSTFRVDLLLTIAAWLEQIEVGSEDTAESFKAFAVAAIPHNDEEVPPTAAS